MKLRYYLAFDGLTKKMYLACGKDEDAATQSLASMKSNVPGAPGSDGDEFTLAEVALPTKGKPVEIPASFLSLLA
jgi:hypothetical protein